MRTTQSPIPSPIDDDMNCVNPVSDDSSSEDETMIVEETTGTPIVPEERQEHPRRRSVTFRENLTSYHEIPTRDSFSLNERRATWLSREEKEAMRRDAYAAIELLGKEDSACCRDAADCLRGLECRTALGLELAKNNRARASFCVIDEQDRQDEVGICDPNLIARVYQGVSIDCRCVSYAQGLVDAQEVLFDNQAAPRRISFNQALAHSIQVHLFNSNNNNRSSDEQVEEKKQQTSPGLQGGCQQEADGMSVGAMVVDMDCSAVQA